ncbi:hydroxyectoine utilization dehydratase EutB [Labrenzia sp. VG12]|uniref:hydroxyectoine utilization dehydratase EutB n=1 Tax=Labrenzia sp. VG12 TaxID=2021862 RepID=UPI000B8BC36C|nr:hydroxyectoine utilization dehydratase EutB [Labrenzia sp. VG12]ASP32768.1 hydroxyectoine utilization dehydratase EutB [Labrenzia sp. VG12]
MDLTLSDILAAQKAISGKVVRTPLLPSRHLSAVAGTPFFLKMESMQPTGAFKLRGATNAAQNVPAGTHTLVCCSTGNHGRGVAYAARERGLKAVICMSSLVPRTKVDGIKALGAEARIVGTSQDDALRECQKLSGAEGVVEISPFDDPHVIAGQGTLGLEILQDLPELKTLLVPLSGGGLAAGVALAAKSVNPAIHIVGLTMDRGAAMKASIDAGRPVEVPEVPSLADSLGGGIGLDNRLSFQMCRDLLDDIVLVSEDEIYRAMQVLYYEDSHVAEGACVVGIAACLAGKLSHLKGPVATIITGRNVDMDQFTRVVTGQDIQLGDYHLKGTPYGA